MDGQGAAASGEAAIGGLSGNLTEHSTWLSEKEFLNQNLLVM